MVLFLFRSNNVTYQCNCTFRNWFLMILFKYTNLVCIHYNKSTARLRKHFVMFPVICKDMECLFELLVKSIQYALNITLISKTKLPPTQEAMRWRRSVNTSKLISMISMTPKPITYILNYIYFALISINVNLGQSIVKIR